MRRIGEMKTARSRQWHYHAQRRQPTTTGEESADSMSGMSAMSSGEDNSNTISHTIIDELLCRKYGRWVGGYPSPPTLQLRIDGTDYLQPDVPGLLASNLLLKHIQSVHFFARLPPAETAKARAQHATHVQEVILQFPQVKSLYIDFQAIHSWPEEPLPLDFTTLLRQIAPQLEVLSLPESSNLFPPPDPSLLIPQLSNLKALPMVPGPPAGVLLNLTQLEALRFHGHLFHHKSLDFVLDVRTLSLNHRLRSLSYLVGSALGLFGLFADPNHPGFEGKMRILFDSFIVASQVDIDEDARAYKPANLTRLIVANEDHIIHRLPSLTSLEITDVMECALTLTSALKNGLRDLRLHVKRQHPDFSNFTRYGESRFDLPDLPNLTTLHLKITHEMFSYRMMKDDMMRLFTHVPALTELHLNALLLAFSPFSQLLQQLIHFTLTLHQPLDYMDELYQSLARLPYFRTLELVLSEKYRMLSTATNAAAAAAAVIAAEEKKRKEEAEVANKKKKKPTPAEPPTASNYYSIIIFPLSQSFFLSLIASSTWCILRLRADSKPISFTAEELSKEELMKRQRPTWNPSTNECDAAIPDLKLILENHANQTERIMLQVNKFRVYYLVGENDEQHQCYGLVKLKTVAGATSSEAATTTREVVDAAAILSPSVDQQQQQRYGWRQHLMIV